MTTRQGEAKGALFKLSKLLNDLKGDSAAQQAAIPKIREELATLESKLPSLQIAYEIANMVYTKYCQDNHTSPIADWVTYDSIRVSLHDNQWAIAGMQESFALRDARLATLRPLENCKKSIAELRARLDPASASINERLKGAQNEIDQHVEALAAMAAPWVRHRPFQLGTRYQTLTAARPMQATLLESTRTLARVNAYIQALPSAPDLETLGRICQAIMSVLGYGIEGSDWCKLIFDQGAKPTLGSLLPGLSRMPEFSCDVNSLVM